MEIATFSHFKPLAEDLMQDGRTDEPPRCGVSLAAFSQVKIAPASLR